MLLDFGVLLLLETVYDPLLLLMFGTYTVFDFDDNEVDNVDPLCTVSDDECDESMLIDGPECTAGGVECTLGVVTCSGVDESTVWFAGVELIWIPDGGVTGVEPICALGKGTLGVGIADGVTELITTTLVDGRALLNCDDVHPEFDSDTVRLGCTIGITTTGCDTMPGEETTPVTVDVCGRVAALAGATGVPTRVGAIGVPPYTTGVCAGPVLATSGPPSTAAIVAVPSPGSIVTVSSCISLSVARAAASAVSL